MKRLVLAALLGAAMAAAGCGTDDEEEAARGAGATTPAPTAAQPTAQATEAAGEGQQPAQKPRKRGTAIKSGRSQYGTVLFDGMGQAIYLFDKETSEKPECYGDCAEAWPPVLTEGDPVARGAIEQSLLATTPRRDGKTQVTYNGHPLYYYAHEGPDEVRCHNVPGFGGLWLALEPGGDAVS